MVSAQRLVREKDLFSGVTNLGFIQLQLCRKKLKSAFSQSRYTDSKWIIQKRCVTDVTFRGIFKHCGIACIVCYYSTATSFMIKDNKAEMDFRTLKIMITMMLHCAMSTRISGNKKREKRTWMEVANLFFRRFSCVFTIHLSDAFRSFAPLKLLSFTEGKNAS